MIREKILRTFFKLRYCVLWPGDWSDIGFTERPIWLNNEGYGYFFDDEPCNFEILEGITNSEIAILKDKLRVGELTVNDIIGTPFEHISNFNSIEYWNTHLDDFARLPDSVENSIYCGESIDGWMFFASEEELIQTFAKDSSDYNFGEKWIDMSDECLQIWYDRIFVNKPELCIPITLDILNKQ